MMSKALYYLVIKPLSWLPFSLLYLLSSFLYVVLYKLVGYRKKVVIRNLTASFPDKSDAEINQIVSRFYKHLSDLIVESVKFFSISKRQALQRLHVINPELIDDYADKGQSVIIVGGHYCNWEIIAIALDLNIKHQSVALFTKQNDVFFNKVMLESRTKFGIKMVTTKDSARYFEQESRDNTAIIFGADQSPTYNKNVVWTHFLNQETALAFGTERYAKKYDYPVLYGAIQRTKRGHYSFELSLITDKPNETAHGFISIEHTRRLEKQILDEPSNWLWTHKRWKRTRKEGESITTVEKEI